MMNTSTKICVFLVLFVALPSLAITETINGITWTYTVSNGGASVGGGTSSSPAIPTSTSGAITIPSTLGGYPVVGIGSHAFHSCGKLTRVTIGNSVTNIGDWAFYYCKGLTSVTIPDGVTSIGSRAFLSCDGLANVTIGNGVTSIRYDAFSDCYKLTSFVVDENNAKYSSANGLLLSKDGLTLIQGVNGNVTVPDSVTSIGSSAFSGCYGLTNVTIGSSVTNIGSSAFSRCYGLTSFVVEEDNSKYSSANGLLLSKDGLTLIQGVNGNVTIPNSVTSIENLAFYDCGELTSVVIPNSVTNIGNNAFSGCTGLASVSIPNSVMSLGDSAFSGCLRLESVMIPNSVTNIGDYTFENCIFLTSVRIPDSVVSIGKQVFRGCRSLADSNGFVVVGNVLYDCLDYVASTTSVTIPNGVKSIGESALSGCNNFTSITIPDSVTNIGSSAFSSCSSLTNVTIGNGVASIGSSAFYNCGRLTSVQIADLAAWCKISFADSYANPLCYAHDLYLNGSLVTDLEIPNSATNIGSYAFYCCSSLASVTIPNSVTRIGGSAFYGCSGLTSVTIPDSVTSIEFYAFYGCSGLTNVIFEGNAPAMGRLAFSGVDSACCVWVYHPSSGWGVDIPGKWQDLTIDYARYTVEFDANGGTSGTESLVAYRGESIGDLPIPTCLGAEFLGWYTASQEGDKVEASTIITKPMTLYAHWLTEVAVPVIATVGDGGDVFRLDSCEVMISCATEGAKIYYTDDGSTPKRNDNYLYSGPINIMDTTTFKAIAVYGSLKSEYSTITITKQGVSLEEALDVDNGVTIATDSTMPWKSSLDSSAKVGDATVRSGTVGDRASTWLSATVYGAGTMSFWCKVSCEHDEDNTFTWDRLMVYTNDVEISDWRMDGETDWVWRDVRFDGGMNTIKWVYYKDKSGVEGEDCAWVDGVSWVPCSADVVVDVEGEKSVVVSGEWLAEHENFMRDKGGDISTALQSKAANGRLSVFDCYVVGLDPEDTTNDFTITSFRMKADGTPDLSALTFYPPQTKWNVSGAMPKLKGKAELSSPWQDVPPEGNPAFRFFTIAVELP